MRRREEEYLETMYILMKRKKVIRVKDLSKALGIKPPSVIEYLKRLAEKGLIHYEKYEYIFLTDEGLAIAKRVYERHLALREFLSDILMLPNDIAEKDACRMEHVLHDTTLERITRLTDFIKKYSEISPEFLDNLKNHYAAMSSELP
ncbi:MAG: metal-dependent transcriptional regulator [Thermoprotei archaeon]|nr:MAG: metal-dependent transcriptional regulator [Thermoprotei archaeon]RLE87862.1 MAG: metal-dependent transcriptional regulator [Thermoprotei archaeon]